MASFPLPPMRGTDEAGAAKTNLEHNGWRPQVTPSGEMASLTDGTTELINRRLKGNRPRVVVGGCGWTIASSRARSDGKVPA